jgi:galactose mutarotase-like enzyme
MPDSMNHENFTPCTLDVGEVYDYTTIFKFVNQ